MSEPIFSLPFKLRIKHKAQVPGQAIQFTDEEIGARVHLKARFARDQRDTSDCDSQEHEQHLEEHHWAKRHGTI